MDRRKFLKLLGLAFGAVTVRFAFPWQEAAARSTAIAYRGLLYRGDNHGQILVSSDGGDTWRVQTKLGPDRSVRKLAVDRHDRLQATIGYHRHRFRLTLAPDTGYWRTN
jgi:hypothetical protein